MNQSVWILNLRNLLRDYRHVGDYVTHRCGVRGKVQNFFWNGTHLWVTVRFSSWTEASVVDSYVKENGDG